MCTKTPVSILQELMARKNAPLPKYTMITKSHMPCPDRFECVVQCADVIAKGTAANKRDAKHESAKKALHLIGYDFEANNKLNCDKIDVPKRGLGESDFGVNYVGKLNEAVVPNRYCGYPEYSYDADLQTGNYKVHCQIVALSLTETGYGGTKKEAKQHAAKLMLDRLANNNIKDLMSKYNEQRLEFLAKNDDAVREKFAKLSISNTVFGKTTLQTKCEIEAVPFVEDAETIEDMEQLLKKNYIKYSMKFLTRNPYLVILTVDDTAVTHFGKGTVITHLGSGPTKEEAIRDVLKQTVFMLENGCSMSVDLTS